MNNLLPTTVTIWTLTLSLVAPPPAAHAQQQRTTAGKKTPPAETIEKVPAPKEPFVKPTGDRAAWTMRFLNAKPDAAAQTRFIREINVVKTGKIKRQTTVWSDGGTEEIWYCNGLMFVKKPEWKTVTIVNPEKSGGYLADPAQVDFYELLWLRAGNFVGQTKMEKRECYYFSSKPAADSDAPTVSVSEQLALGEAAAWIDARTLLPVALRDHDGLRVYLFESPPDKDLALPGAFQQEYARYQAALRDVERYKMPPRKYQPPVAR